MVKCNSLSIDVNGLMEALIRAALAAMEDVEMSAFEVLAKEISDNSESQTKWRAEAIGLLREVKREVLMDRISVEFGVDLASVSGDALNRVMVALYGNQAGGPIHSKPGESVYGKAMDGKHPSTAQTTYDIPQYNHPQSYNGDQMFSNTFKLIATIFKDAIAAAWRSVDFSQFVLVSGG